VLDVTGQRDADFRAADAVDCSSLESVQHVAVLLEERRSCSLTWFPQRGTPSICSRGATLVCRRTGVDAPPVPAEVDQHASRPVFVAQRCERERERTADELQHDILILD
jgi:hypothetical protein